MSPFVVLSLPRSRTTWLSKFLSYRDWECGHDQLRYMRSLQDVKNWLSLDKFGTCETGGAPFWRLLLKYAPDIRVVTIRRPVDEVIGSLAKLGMENLYDIRKGLIKLNHKLDQIEGRMPNVRSYDYNDLEDEATCGELFEFCLPYGHDPEWWNKWDKINVQTNFLALTRYVGAHIKDIDKLASQAGQAMFKDMAVKVRDVGGISIDEVSCEVWKRDCQELFRQHCAYVEEHPDNWINKNWGLFEELHRLGFMQIMVARSNGRTFGYLMTLLSPSLDEPGQMLAQHTTFFADKDTPGIGLKLQRAAIAKLKEKKVTEVVMRAAHRGDGDRMGPLYKRLGAYEFGRVYRLELRN